VAVIDHVIVLMLENRSFDHMLGYLDHPDPQFDGLLRGGPHTNPGWDGGDPVAASPEAKPVLPYDPDHSHHAVMEQLALTGSGPDRRATNQGFVSSYEREGRGLATPIFGGPLGPLLNWWSRRSASETPPVQGRGPLAMLCQPAANVPVLSTLALEFCVYTNWFCSVPGETWPNRNFLHAATSDGETEIALRFYTDPTIFELLEEHGRSWHIYHDDTPQVWAFPKLWDTPARHANWFGFSEFAAHAAAGTLPAYSFIEPNHRPPLHTLGHDPIIGVPDVSDSQHPGNNSVTDETYDAFTADVDTDFARGEGLIASVYESLRANPELFERSLLLITYDEHGGIYDHVPPPTGVPNPGAVPRFGARLMNALYHRTGSTFDFGMLGPRVPTVVVSPYVAAHAVRTEVHDHTSVPATLRALFAPDAPPLTARDAWASTFHSALDLTEPRRADLPDLSAYAAAGPGSAAAAKSAQAQEAQAEAAAQHPVPDYYRSFADQAELMWQRLRKLGEPETLRPIATEGLGRSADISAAFARAAERHRSTAAIQWPAPTSRNLPPEP
jgi:phospholipase C